MEHSDLVAEITAVEKMSTQERLKHAKKRRQQQLKKFSQYEKALDKENNKKRKNMGKGNNKMRHQQREIKVHFVNNIMLLESAARNDVDEVRNLLMLGVDPDVTNEDGLTALHQCCIDDLEEMMRLLISFNANVNARDSELWTPLHAAATCGHVHLCKFLIDHGAELLAVNADGNMAYDICEDGVTLDFIENEMAKRGVTQELIDETRLSTERKMLDDLHDLSAHGESLVFLGRNGETPLHIAAANGYIQVSEYLISQNVPLDELDDDSWQPIHAAACWGHLPILELLVHHGADIDARTKTGETPFDICEDLELKQRIMEMKDELAASRRTPTKELKRRKSQNTRSGGNLTGSAPSLYNSTTSLSDKNPHSASIRRTSMREKSQLSWKEAREEATRLRGSAGSDYDDDDEEPAQNGHHTPGNTEYGDSLPVSNIDDVQVTIPPEPQPREPERPTEERNGPSVPTHKSTHVTHSTHSSVEIIHKPAHQITTKVDTPTPVTGNGTSSHSSSLSREIPREESDGPRPPDTTSVGAGDAGAQQNTASSQRPPTQPALAGQGMGGPHSSGTLADLKKQRQQKLQDSLRFKDPSAVDKEIQNYNANHTENGKTDIPDTTMSNGKNVSIHNNTVYYGSNTGDPPKKRFTATTEIVGGGETNTSCCVIL